MFKYLLYFSLISPILGVSQQQIKGVFFPATDYKSTILYRLSEGKSTYVSYGFVNPYGEIQIDLDASVPAGIYRLVYALPQSEFNFEFIYNGLESIEFKFNTETGVEFINSKENQLLYSYNSSIAIAQNELVQLYAQPKFDSLIYLRRAQKIDSLQNTFEEISNGTLASHFISANKSYIPARVEPVNSYVSNVKSNYFKAIDFQDPVLQGSNFIIDKLREYILKIHISSTPSFQDYQANIDMIFRVLETTDVNYQLTTLNILRDTILEAGYDSVALYLTKIYVLPLAKQLNDTELITSLEAVLRITLGVKAPNFRIENPSNPSNQTLYDLDGATTYLLIFWSSDCGHCLNELPELHDYISKRPQKNISVIAIGIENNNLQWSKTIAPWSKFIHSIAEGKWEHAITKSYSIEATPTYFVLDASKVIRAKPYSLRDLIAVLNQK